MNSDLSRIALFLILLGAIASAKMMGPKLALKSELKNAAKPKLEATQRLIGSASRLIPKLGSLPIKGLNTEEKLSADTTMVTPTSKTAGSVKSAKPLFTVDENAIKGAKRIPDAIDSSDDGEAAKRSEHRNPPTVMGAGNPTGIPERFDHMWPVCFFIDPSVANGNQIVKEVTDMAANCRVNLVAFPFFIKPNYPKNFDAINKAAARSCNAVQGMSKLGVARASVVTLVNDASIPKQMCNALSIPESNSCAQVGYRVPPGQRARMEATGTWGGEAASGQAAASIVGPGGLNATTVAGRLQGQAQMAFPFGSKNGNGTGDFSEGYATAGAGAQNGWSDDACKKMRETAFPNTGNFKYLKTQKDYVALGKNLWDIQGERTVFNVGNPGGGAVQPTPNHPARGEASFTQNFFPSSLQATSKTPSDPLGSGSTATLVPEGVLDIKHKLRSSTTPSESGAPLEQPKTKPRIQPRIQIGGQLISLDNKFMGQTSPATDPTRTLAGSIGSQSPSDLTNPLAIDPSVRARVSSRESSLDADYLANQKRRDEAAGPARQKGSALRVQKE